MAREIAIVSEANIATVQLLRRMLQHLEESQGLLWTVTLGAIFGNLTLRPEAFPLIVRSCDPEAMRLARLLHRRRIPYGFYLDDNFWLLDLETALGRHYRSAPIQRNLNWIVRHAHVVVASTPLLRDYVSRLNRHAVVLDPHVDLDLMPPLTDLPRRRRVRAGFAGSIYRGVDLAHIAAAVMAALERHEDLEFELIGPSGALPAHPRITAFPYQDTYAEYVELQRSREWDFALAPLGAVASNLYKTDSKFREYAAQGIPGIYEEAAPYAHVVDGVTGLLVGKRRSWDEAIELYVADEGLRSDVRRNAREEVEQRRSIAAVEGAWASFYEAMPEAGTSPGFARARDAIEAPPSRAVRTCLRFRLLEIAGLVAIEELGFWATAWRTARFLRRRIVAHIAATALRFRERA